MLLHALYNFTPRGEDSNKTLAFQQNDILMFLEVYPKDGNWLQVAARNGRIGYIPKNYVQISDDIGRDAVLEFLLEATLRARREKLDSIETLESLKDHVVRIEYREFQARSLRQAMKYQQEEPTVETDDGTNYMDEKPNIQGRSTSAARIHHERERNDVQNGSISTLYTAKSEKTNEISIKTEPVMSKSKILSTPKKPNLKKAVKYSSETEQPVSGRASKSCPLGPSIGRFNMIPDADVDKKASGDTLTSPKSSDTSFTSNAKTYTKEPSSKIQTRIPIRTPVKFSRLEGTTTTPSEYSHLPLSNLSGSSEQMGHRRQDWERMASRLIKIVQESGGLDFKQSEVVVHRVLHHIHENFHPSMPDQVGSVLRTLEKSPWSGLGSEVETGGFKELKEALKFLTLLGKQSVHENQTIADESVVLDKLEQLNDELINLEPKVLKKVMEMDQYNSIHDLVLLYQSETRVSIKNKLLEIFSILSTMDNHSRSVLLRSILPIELVREMHGSEGSPKKLSRISNVLISLMATGESMPETHYDHLGTKFINFLLNYIEEPKQGESDEKAKADCMNLILAYNLQFTPKDENLIIKTLAGRAPGRYFIEAILYLFEKEADPIKGGGQVLESVPHSVFKLMKDMFSSKMTAEHFHTAEMKVLIDSVAQSLSNLLGPGDNRRTDYLELTWLVLRNSSFQYRISDIRECLVAILLEEDPLSIPDQRIVKGISKEFPAIFKKGNNVIGKAKGRLGDPESIRIPF